MNQARENQQAGLLKDGTVLITGGDNGSIPLSSSELYMNGAFTPAASMLTARSGHQQTVLSIGAGQVLITGGTDGTSLALSSAELFTPGSTPGTPGSFQLTTQYDPAAQIFTNNPTTMTTPRAKHTATQLTNGQVLIAGGRDASGNPLASAELFNPLTGSFTATGGPMQVARIGHNATLLLDGTVLMSGGTDQNGNPIQSAEIYDPVANNFTSTKQMMNVARIGSQATRLGSGLVLITGGQYESNTAELYNPVTGTFIYTESQTGQTLMIASRSNHTATLLYDDTVLISGGQDSRIHFVLRTIQYSNRSGYVNSSGNSNRI
ncbi:kelch repeat-containing protein [Granulicella mallensis]|uniref:Kelch repeat type 1-containing protein n=1 Tax=Granulicella mallensis TaxID=940614 RepID=A0A7W8EA37_9BACT|nr:kelch repeat-containing protein [Granulicella mallensis]MBB5064397.1 hypothetical protein [Granulicella mallensis]